MLFDVHPEQSSIMSLRIDAEGRIEAPCMKRSLDEVYALQTDAKVWVVLSSYQVSFYQVDLPWLAERKASVAIGYALEDEVAQPLDAVHFAFSKAFFKNNQYQVVAIDQIKLTAILAFLKQMAIEPQVVTVDWFALEKNQICLSPYGLCIHTPQFKGGILNAGVDYYWQHFRKDIKAMTEVGTDLREPEFLGFSDSLSFEKIKPTQHIAHLFYEWVAQHLVHRPFINLCQGRFQNQHRQYQPVFWYKCTAFAALLWLTGIFLTNVLQYYVLNHAINQQDIEIKQLYKTFFPEAKEVISPRFRIGQILDSSANNGENQVFWQLMAKLSQGFRQRSVDIKQIQFQNTMLSVEILVSNYAQLDAFQQRLKQQGLKVRQSQAMNTNKKVSATLELSL